MASNYSIKESEIVSVHVQAANDVLTDTPKNNKAVFDRYPDLIAEKFNAFVEYAEAGITASTTLAQVISALFPIGCIVRNTDNTNPRSYLNIGTWVQIEGMTEVASRADDNAPVTVYYWERKY